MNKTGPAESQGRWTVGQQACALSKAGSKERSHAGIPAADRSNDAGARPRTTPACIPLIGSKYRRTATRYYKSLGGGDTGRGGRRWGVRQLIIFGSARLCFCAMPHTHSSHFTVDYDVNVSTYASAFISSCTARPCHGL
jgi:hypothetical protein